ncbi:MAG: hypothetical protein CM1200mP34_2820 [Verrucomicrobiales bacterium]|nr:MAG: hypothetical protein CM1200mP34_2820 [Verrucomicrobiales bacterium]
MDGLKLRVLFGQPHLLATFTTSITLPLWAPRFGLLAVNVLEGMSRVDFSAQTAPAQTDGEDDR